MPSVTIRDGCLWAGDQRIPLLMGEIQFWRLNPARWGDILNRFRQLGLGTVSTYVCWHYHELAPGRFDFTGETEPARNLLGFLDLLHEKGFWVFVRPGPYAYAEWTNAGVPDRVVGLPRLSDEYRREASVWMRAVVDVLRPYFATASERGRIVLLQPDNELDLFSHWFESPSGLDGTRAGYFQRFLRETYPSIGALNDAWGTAYGTLDEAQAFAEPTDRADPRLRTRARDYWRFQHWAVREGMRWHAEEYRRLGVDLPMIANYYPGGDVQNWRELKSVIDLVGIDWYPRNEFGAGNAPGQGASMTGAGPHAPEEEHRRFLDTCRYQRAISPIPWSPELECGVWHGYHEHVGVLSSNHYRLMFFSAMIAGLKGVNWYMFAGRDNWYYTPINERGDLRPELAEVFIDLHRAWREIDPPSLWKLCSAAAAFDLTQAGTDGMFAENPSLRALYDADADFEFFDPCIAPDPADARPAGANAEAARKPLMFYAGADWLGRAAQARLLEYVESGGTLVLFRQRPTRDETFREHNGLGLIEPDRVLSRLGKKVRLGFARSESPSAQSPLHHGRGPDESLSAVAEGAVWTWDEPTLGAAGCEPIWGTQIAGTQQAVENADVWMNSYRGRRWICGYRQPRGLGAIVQIGLPANAALVRALHSWLGVPLFAQSALPGVHTALYRRPDGSHVLFATNMNGSDLHCRVRLDGADLPDPAAAYDLRTGRDAPVAGGDVVLDLPRRSGGVWTIARSAQYARSIPAPG